MKDIIDSKSMAHNSPSIQVMQVDSESAGQRLDNFLMRHLKGAPKTLIYRIIRSGEVRINKGRVRAQTRIAEGDQIRLPPIRLSLATETPVRAAQAREFPVLFEDDGLLVIDKPAGVAVHGGSGISFGVIEQLRQARPAARTLELVHRLDRETSGLLLIAKKRSTLKNLQDQFRARDIGKTYLAMVQGKWTAKQQLIDLPLQKYLVPQSLAGGERRVRVVGPENPDGRRAITRVKLLRLVGADSLLEVAIKTGRTHQIRVHLAYSGHPILGDTKYGHFETNHKRSKLGLDRMFLHAWKIQFRHPVSGENLHIECPLPAELQRQLDAESQVEGG